MRRGPTVPAALVVVAADLALRASSTQPGLAVALLAASTAALGTGPLGRIGLSGVAIALGLLAVWSRPPELTAPPGGGVVTVEGRASGPWTRGSFGWRGLIEVRRVVDRLGSRPARGRIWVSLPNRDRAPPASAFRARGILRPPSTFGNGTVLARGHPSLAVKSERLIDRRGPEGGWRHRFRQAWMGAVDDPERPGHGIGLARALVLGDPSGLDPELVIGLRRAGLAHLLALSGLHVGIVTAVALQVGRLLGGGWRFTCPAVAVVGMVAMVGPRASVLRAAGMGGFVWAALAGGARPRRWRALTLVAAAMVLWRPEIVRERAFVLTVAATAGILTALAAVPAAGRGSSRPVMASLRVGLGAQLATAPWALPAFSLAAPLSLVHNLWAVPGTALLVVSGSVWLAVAACSPALARASSLVLEVAATPFVALARFGPGPWFSIPWRAAPLATLAVAAAGLRALHRPAWWPVVALLLCVAGYSQSAGYGPELVMLDVGQGDAILIRDGPVAVLVDGGGWSGGDIAGRVLVPALARLGVRRLEAVVMTHSDRDHCEGLSGLTGYVRVEELWSSPGWSPSPCFDRLVGRPGVRWRPLWRGHRRRVGRWRLTALHPPAGDRRSGNARSLVLRAELGPFVALLTGDLDAGAERELVAAEGLALRAGLLKVAHHGSKSSTSSAFLEAVSPAMAWISAGPGNRYGHPHPTVLGRLAERSVRVLRTDRDGQVRLRVGPRGTVHLEMPGSPK